MLVRPSVAMNNDTAFIYTHKISGGLVATSQGLQELWSPDFRKIRSLGAISIASKHSSRIIAVPISKQQELFKHREPMPFHTETFGKNYSVYLKNHYQLKLGNAREAAIWDNFKDPVL